MAKEYTDGFYLTKSWRDCRHNYLLTQDFICERCGGPAKVVHHKDYITPKTINNTSVTLSHDNLEALCQDCHNKEHHKDFDITMPGTMFNQSGELVSVKPLGG